MARAKHKRRKLEINDLMSFCKFPTSSRQKREDLIQTTELQELQIDPEIQIENLRKLAVEFP